MRYFFIFIIGLFTCSLYPINAGDDVHIDDLQDHIILMLIELNLAYKKCRKTKTITVEALQQSVINKIKKMPSASIDDFIRLYLESFVEYLAIISKESTEQATINKALLNKVKRVKHTNGQKEKTLASLDTIRRNLLREKKYSTSTQETSRTYPKSHRCLKV